MSVSFPCEYTNQVSLIICRNTVDKSSRTTSLRILCHDCLIGRSRLFSGMDGLPQVSFIFFPQSFYQTPVSSVWLLRLAKIRKVGLSSTSQKRKSTKPWLPLPLRNRIPGGWSWPTSQVVIFYSHINPCIFSTLVYDISSYYWNRAELITPLTI